jgi:hypothetical protein
LKDWSVAVEDRLSAALNDPAKLNGVPNAGLDDGKIRTASQNEIWPRGLYMRLRSACDTVSATLTENRLKA